MKMILRYTLLACLVGAMLLAAPGSASAEGIMTLPSALKVIEQEAFYGVAALDKVVIPEGTTEIHSRAFVGCSLAEVVLPSTLTYIAADAFDVDTGMDVTAPAGSYAYERCVELGLINPAVDEPTPAVHFTYDIINGSECVITSYTGTEANVVIPAELDGYPVKRIGKAAFRDCTGLTSISLPDGVMLIDDSAFKGCTALEYVRLPDSITTFGESVFENCEKLRSVNYPRSWKSAEEDIFKGCKALTKMVVPQGVTRIPPVAFANANYLEHIELPGTLTEIGSCAFDNCIALETIRLPERIASIEAYAFRGCTQLRSVNYPFNWTTADTGIFQGCEALTTIVIPKGVTRIPANAFADADCLTSVEFPASLKEIGSGAFTRCSALTSIEIPAGVAVIEGYTFDYCTSLTSFRAASGLLRIEEYAFNECSSLTNVELPDGLTSIATYAFHRCTALDSIHLPDTVSELGYAAFRDCTSLRDVNYPQALTSGSNVFYGCKSLTTMVIPDGVTRLPNSAFYNLPSLTRVDIPSSVTAIGTSAFSGCANLTIHGVSGSYAQTYASRNRIKFAAAPLPAVSLSVETTGNTAGCILTVTASAANGTAPYSYRYTLNKDGVPIRETEYTNNSQYRVAFDGAGSYQIAVEAKDRIGSVGAARSATYTIGNAVITTMGGRITLTNETPVKDITVFIYGIAEDSSSAHITETDEDGYWSFDKAIVGHQYCIKYAHDAYLITPAEENVTARENMKLMATATIMQSAEYAGAVTFTMTDGANLITSVPTGKPVVFNIQAPNATRARLIVDGIVYDSFSVNDGNAVFARAFAQAGLRSIVFQAGNESGWGTISAAQMLNVTASGQLAAPSFVTAANQQHIYGSDVTIAWNPVAHASAYNLYLYCNGILIWQSAEAISGTTYTLDAALLPAGGKYVFNVMATGYGYSQSEGSLPFELIGKGGAVTLLTPITGGSYVIGDTFYISVSNPAGAYVRVEIRQPDGKAILLPQTGAVMDTTVTLNYQPTMVGTYTIQAYAFESADMITTALASSSSNVAALTVAGAQLTNVCVGTGYGNMLATDAARAQATTNTAVEYVEIYEGGTLLATMRAHTEKNFIRTFTTALSVPTSGLHTYVFKAYDAEGEISGTREVAFYAVQPCAQKTVYSQQHDIRLLKYPAADAAALAEPVYVSDALTLLGTCGDYSYVQLGALKGYVATSQISDTQTYTIPDLSLKLVMPRNNSFDYLGHTMTVQWNCNIAISDAMKYVLVITPAANPLYVRRVEAAANRVELFTGNFQTGDYSFRVELTNNDESVVYASSPSATVYFCRNYEEYLETLHHDPLRYWADQLVDDVAVVRNSQKMFTTGATLDDGTIAHFDLEALTNGKMKALLAIATGEYSASLDDLEVVRALTIANMIAEQYGSSNGLLDLELLKDLISWLGLPEDLSWDVMFPRKYHDGKWYVSLDEEEYKLNIKNHAIAQKLNKAGDWIGYSQAIVNVIERYSLYASIDSERLTDIADHFEATNDTTLQYAAGYLRMMSSRPGALVLSTLMQGADFSQETLNAAVTEGGWAIAKKLVKNTHLAAFLVGAKIGAKAGQMFNKTFLNIDEIYSAAFVTQYCADAADAFYPYVSYVRGKFNVDPVRYHDEFYTVVELYGRMVAGCFDASKKFFEGIDKAWAERFWNWVRNNNENAETINTCSEMAEMLRSYFEYDYMQFLAAAGVMDETSLQMIIKGFDLPQLILQPQNQYVQAGQRATFTVAVKGEGLTYQWYINRGDGNGWCKLKGATSDRYTTSQAELGHNGYQYRCVITDIYGSEITSAIAVLCVTTELPVTGDASDPVLWLVLWLLSVVGIAIVKKKSIIA